MLNVARVNYDVIDWLSDQEWTNLIGRHILCDRLSTNHGFHVPQENTCHTCLFVLHNKINKKGQSAKKHQGKQTYLFSYHQQASKWCSQPAQRSTRRWLSPRHHPWVSKWWHFTSQGGLTGKSHVDVVVKVNKSKTDQPGPGSHVTWFAPSIIFWTDFLEILHRPFSSPILTL